MATCKRRSKEELWASSMRQTSPFEMTIRRYIGYTCLALSVIVAEWFKRFDSWNIAKYENSETPTFDTLVRSSSLMSLSGAGIMLYVMGELSQ